MTQPPYQPPESPPPYGYPQTPPPGYPPVGYPPAPPPAGGYPQFGSQPKVGRRLLWTWIGFLGLGVIAFAFFIAWAAQWALAASRVGVPPSSTATYGTVTAVQGSALQVHVPAGTALIQRTETHVFNRTSSATSIQHVFAAFDSTVTGAPSTPVGGTVSFTYKSDSSNGTYLAVAPSKIKAAGHVPTAMIASLIVGIVLGLIGVVLLIVWLVSRHRRKSGATSRYSPPPPGYGPPPPGYGSPGYGLPPPGYGPPPAYWPQNPQPR